VGPADLSGQVLIHGDLHWRNVGLAAGRPMLLGGENMRAAPPLLEFGKRDNFGCLSDARQRAALLRGYDRHATPVWPWPRAMRLHTTAGVLVYALATADHTFAAHGYRALAALDTPHQPAD
jgi:hypothetical protein